MRKLFLPLIAALFLLFAVSAHAGSYEEARFLADFMEEHYSVTILIGDKCNDVPMDGFVIGDKPSGRTPLQNLLGSVDYRYEVELLDDCFAVYPPGFFERFRCDESPTGIRFLLPNSILLEDQTMAGVTTIADGYFNVFLGLGAFNRLNVHHELWHAIEYRITADYPDAFIGWSELNPEGFHYDNDYLGSDIWTFADPKDDWFVRGYSTVNEYEDRATVVEAVIEKGEEWWASHPHIREKRDFLSTALHTVFGNVYEAGAKEAFP